MYGLTVVTAPTSLPVTLDEVKRQVGVAIDSSYHDSMLDSYIRAATDYVERYCNRQLVTATYDLQLDYFPSGLDPIYLPKAAPLSSVTSITYLAAADGTSTTWTSSEYRVLTSSEPGKIVPAWSYTYPATRDIDGAVTVRYVCGQAVASVPVVLKSAIKLIVTTLFDNPAGGVLETDCLKALLESYRVADDYIRYERECEYA